MTTATTEILTTTTATPKIDRKRQTKTAKTKQQKQQPTLCPFLCHKPINHNTDRASTSARRLLRGCEGPPPIPPSAVSPSRRLAKHLLQFLCVAKMGKRCGLFVLSMGLLAISLAHLAFSGSGQVSSASNKLLQEDIVESIRQLQSSDTAGRRAEDGFSNISTSFVKRPSMDRPNDLGNALAKEGGKDVSQWLGTAATARNLGPNVETTIYQNGVGKAELLLTHTLTNELMVNVMRYRETDCTFYYEFTGSDALLKMRRVIVFPCTKEEKDTLSSHAADQSYSYEKKGNRYFLSIESGGEAVLSGESRYVNEREEIVVGKDLFTKLRDQGADMSKPSVPVHGIWKQIGEHIFVFYISGVHRVTSRKHAKNQPQRCGKKANCDMKSLTTNEDGEDILFVRKSPHFPKVQLMEGHCSAVTRTSTSSTSLAWKVYSGPSDNFEPTDDKFAKWNYNKNPGMSDQTIDVPQFVARWISAVNLPNYDRASWVATSRLDYQVPAVSSDEQTSDEQGVHCQVTATFSSDSIKRTLDHTTPLVDNVLSFYVATDCWDNKPRFLAAVSCGTKKSVSAVGGLCHLYYLHLQKTGGRDNAERGSSSGKGKRKSVGVEEKRRRVDQGDKGKQQPEDSSTAEEKVHDEVDWAEKQVQIMFSIYKDGCTKVHNTLQKLKIVYDLVSPKGPHYPKPKGSMQLICLT
eukprot:GHVS01023658.1.p1 GENE.GHVS01023658.1~~GHVS01023658.1.p1  ORF type:complete len:690 (+),score=69.37 GHVS01023658.1:157-2226(+)